MKPTPPILFSVCLLLSGLHHAYAVPVTIVQQGKSAFSIVVPQAAPQSLLEAAQELQRDLAESTGAQLPILTTPAKVNGPYMSLGETPQAQAAGLSTKEIGMEGFRIITKDGNLYIVGPDTPDGEHTRTGGKSNGTANGIYTFLEDYLGVRWLLPGDLGRDVPHQPIFEVESLDRTEVPRFFGRRMPYLQNRASAARQWEGRQKLGYSVNIIQRPTWRQNVPPSMLTTHPEWFPLLDGKRAIDTHNYKIETTDPELVKHFASNAIASFKAHPSTYTVSLSPSDYPDGWSESDASKALYDQKRWGYQVTTTLMLKFYHDVSEIVAHEYPQGRLAGYIYDVYKAPPTNPEGKKYLPLPANFYPTLANNADYGFRLYQERNRKELEELVSFWTKQSPQLTYYGIPNRLDITSGVILPPAPVLLNFLFSEITKYPVKAVLLYGNTTWSEGAIGNYVMAKMMWNPRLDARQLQHEWLTRAYGPKAGETMNQFYTKLDQWFDQYYQTNPSGYLYSLSDGLLKSVYAAHYAEMESLFLQARQQTETPQQKERLELLQDNLILLQATLRDKKMLPPDLASPFRRDENQIKQLQQKTYPDFELFPARKS